MKVVYKPRQGESPLWDFPTGSLYKREEAAFLVSDALGWHLVPPTVSRKGDFGMGMVQFYIEHDPEEHFFTFRDPWDEQLTRLILFDVLINNADRKGGHVLREQSGAKLWAIDHGVTFHEEYKLRTVIWELAGESIPQSYLEALAAFQGCIVKGAPLTERLARLLTPDEMGLLRLSPAETGPSPSPLPADPMPWLPVKLRNELPFLFIASHFSFLDHVAIISIEVRRCNTDGRKPGGAPLVFLAVDTV